MHRVIDRLEVNDWGQAVIHASRIGFTFWTKDFVSVGDSAIVSWDAIVVSLAQAGFIPARWEMDNSN